MAGSTPTLHDADRMARRPVMVEGDRIVLFPSSESPIWIVATQSQALQSLIGADGKEIAPDHQVAARSGWIIEPAQTPVAIHVRDEANSSQWFGGTLTDPLLQFFQEPGSNARIALAEMLGRVCSGTDLPGKLPASLIDDQAFDLFRGVAAVARRLGRNRAEVELLNAALAIKSSANIWRLLSYARANAQDYGGAIAAAAEARTAKPDLANGPFRDHLKELRAYCDISAELSAPTFVQRQRGERIAYCLHNCLPHAQGGYAMRSHALAKAIMAQGRDLIAYARPGFPGNGDGSARTKEDRTEVGGVPYRFKTGFGRRGRCYGYIAEATDYFAQRFVADDVGIVHAATNFWTALPAAMAAQRLELPFIYEVRSFWSVSREARTPGFQQTPQAMRDDALEAIVLAMASKILTLNPQMKTRLAAQGVDQNKIEIIPNCVDANRFAPRPKDPDLAARFGLRPGERVIGYMGAMLGYEGLDLLIDAAAPLLKEHNDLRLLLIGANPANRNDPASIEYGLTAQIAKHGLDGKVELVDRIQPDLASIAYSMFDICVYPRRGLEVCELVSPLKPLEAMAAGKMIIGSDVGGLTDLVDNESTGLLFAKDDSAALQRSLSRAIGDTRLCRELGEAARAFVIESRNWQTAAANVARAYSRIAGESQPDRQRIAQTVKAHFGGSDGLLRDFSSAFAAD